MRILLVGNYYPEHQGGIESVTENLARWYRHAGHRVRWLAAEPRRYPHVGHPDDRPLPAWNVTEDHLGFPYPLPHPAAFPAIVREVRACDVVHVHDCLYPTSVTAWLAARAARRPVLATQHVGPVPYRRRALRVLQHAAYATLGRQLLTSVNRVAFVSPAVASWFKSFCSFRRPPIVIPNGVDLDRFQPVDPSVRQELRAQLGVAPATPLLLFVGRFVEKKGIGLLRDVVRAHPDWLWVFIGRPGGEDPAAWRLGNLRVLAPMPPEGLRAYYRAADLLVLPSTGEGFPVVVQEAMACGTPALVSEEVGKGIPSQDAPSPDILFRTGRTSGAVAAEAARALALLQRSPELRIRTAAFAAGAWSWSARARDYAALLDGILTSQSRQEAQGGPVTFP